MKNNQKAKVEEIAKEIFNLDKALKSNESFKKSKTKYIALITSNDGATTTILKTKRIQPNITHFLYKDREMVFDINKHLFKTKTKTYYLFDANDGQLHLDLGDSYKFDQKFLKKIVREKIIAQSFTRFTGTQARNSMIMGIFLMIFGGLIGYLIALITLGVI